MSLMATLFKLSTFLAPIWDFPPFPDSIWDFSTFPGIYPLYLNHQIIYYINFQNKALLFIAIFLYIICYFYMIFVFSVLAEVSLQTSFYFYFIFLLFSVVVYFLWQVGGTSRQSGLCGLRKWKWSGPGFYCGYRVGLGLHLRMPCRCQGRCRLFKISLPTGRAEGKGGHGAESCQQSDVNNLFRTLCQLPQLLMV